MDDGAPAITARLERLFSAQAAAAPEAPAIVFRGRTVTYSELEALSDRFSRRLSEFGLAPGVLVAIRLRRSPELIALLLAIWKCGGAYLPLDPRYPAERARFVLADSGARLLIADDAPIDPAGFDGTILQLHGAVLTRTTAGSVLVPTAPRSLAYVIYTSGSTGKPKGVMLGHGATHLVEWARRAYSPEQLSRVAAATSLSFDPSIFEIFVPLCSGGAVILKENALEPFSPKERPTMFGTVPSALAELCRARAIPQSLLALNVGGETLGRELAEQVYRQSPRLTLYNHYGPTEATTCATVAVVPRKLEGEPSIGRPVRGAEIMLLDEAGEPVAEGEAGEICIGGPGLALGYLNRPELTAERFVRGPGGRLYRTGDIGQWQGGELRYRGRADRQVKVRGFRVELGEVEAAVMRIPEVDGAAAALIGSAGHPTICAYVETRSAMTPDQVRGRLGAWLPDYMAPARIVMVEALPRLVSGKVDYGALQPPEKAPAAAPIDLAMMEKPVVHVFEEVLGIGSVSPEDSFFDLGGDSLSSLHAALRLSELLGREVPAALIHQAPSARQLAAALEHAVVSEAGHISVLHKGGDGPPLFCIADLFGHAFNYLSLARRLAPDRTVYGVAPGPLQEAFARDDDIGRLAESFAAEIRNLRPNGPYFVAGYSSGGMLALELACRLQNEGLPVGLVLLDAYRYSRWPSLRKILRSGRQARRSRFRGLAPRSSAAGLTLVEALARRATGRVALPNWVPRSQMPYARALMRAGLRYRPPRFAGPVLIVRASRPAPLDALFDDGLLGWREALCGEVEQATAEGGHHQFLREPNVAEAASAVSRFLARGIVRSPPHGCPQAISP